MVSAWAMAATVCPAASDAGNVPLVASEAGAAAGGAVVWSAIAVMVAVRSCGA